MTDHVRIEDLRDFFRGFNVKIKGGTGKPPSAAAECGCTAQLVAGTETFPGTFWELGQICATHQKFIDSESPGGMARVELWE